MDQQQSWLLFTNRKAVEKSGWIPDLSRQSERSGASARPAKGNRNLERFAICWRSQASVMGYRVGSMPGPAAWLTRPANSTTPVFRSRMT